MLNLIFNTMIFLICSAIGYAMAHDYQYRVENLKSFIDGLKNLEDEIRYRKTPLPEALYLVSEEKSVNVAKELFANVAMKLIEKSNNNFSEIWSNGLLILEKNSALADTDVNILSELGRSLGGTDIYGQSTVIERACNQLTANLKEAIEENNTKGKMYKSLGIAIGLTIVIILI